MANTLWEVLEEKEEFHPQLLSDDENEFLHEKLGEPIAVALQGGQPQPLPVAYNREGQPIPHSGGPTVYSYTLDDGRKVQVNAPKVRRVMEKLYELRDLSEDSNTRSWCGLDAVKACIRFWMDKYRAEFDKRKAIDPKTHHPSRYAFDSRGNAILQGIGSDSGYVKTWIDKNGKRQPFGIKLTQKAPQFRGNWFAAFTATADDPAQVDEMVEEDPEALHSENGAGKVEQIIEGQSAYTELVVDDDQCLFQCPVCGHTDNWKEGHQGSKNFARERMRKHCVSSDSEVEAHRLLAYEIENA